MDTAPTRCANRYPWGRPQCGAAIAAGQYQFIQGSLDDLPNLPVLQNLAQGLSADAIPTDWCAMREGSGRNNALFRLVGRNAHYCDDFDQLLDCARTQNDQFGEPMQDAEVVKVAQSVWKMTSEGLNRFGQHGACLFPPYDAV